MFLDVVETSQKETGTYGLTVFVDVEETSQKGTVFVDVAETSQNDKKKENSQTNVSCNLNTNLTSFRRNKLNFFFTCFGKEIFFPKSCRPTSTKSKQSLIQETVRLISADGVEHLYLGFSSSKEGGGQLRSLSFLLQKRGEVN